MNTPIEDELRRRLHQRAAQVTPGDQDPYAGVVARSTHYRRRRQGVAAFAAAGVLVAGALIGPAAFNAGPLADRDSSVAGALERLDGPEKASKVAKEILDWPTRGSLAGDQEFLREVEKPLDQAYQRPLASKIIYAGDVGDVRIVLRMEILPYADNEGTFAEVVRVVGPKGAAADSLAMTWPEPGFAADGPLVYANVGEGATPDVMVLAPPDGTTIQLSDRPVFSADASVRRDWRSLETDDGVYHGDASMKELAGTRIRAVAGTKVIADTSFDTLFEPAGSEAFDGVEPTGAWRLPQPSKRLDALVAGAVEAKHVDEVGGLLADLEIRSLGRDPITSVEAAPFDSGAAVALRLRTESGAAFTTTYVAKHHHAQASLFGTRPVPAVRSDEEPIGWVNFCTFRAAVPEANGATSMRVSVEDVAEPSAVEVTEGVGTVKFCDDPERPGTEQSERRQTERAWASRADDGGPFVEATFLDDEGEQTAELKVPFTTEEMADAPSTVGDRVR